jgi:SAM-dependent methyltransferase
MPSEQSGYAYDQAWGEERRRLAGIEAMWDPGTFELLAGHLEPGSSVLEAGAGGGSVVEWLAGEVGGDGRVLAVDLDTRFIDPLASSVVEVRSADITADELPRGEFDLAHARLLLEHLPKRDAALDRLIASLRPGGWLLIEDYDWTSFGFESADETEERATDSIMQFMTDSGFDRHFGRRLVGTLADHGLTEIRGVGRLLAIDDEHPGFPFFSLSFEQLAPAAVKAGLLEEEDARTVSERMEAGGRRLITPTLIAAAGRAV